MKTCTKCGQEKPLEDFAMKNSKPEARCKSCHNAYYKQYYQTNSNRLKHLARVHRNNDVYRAARSKLVRDLKADKPCMDCGKIFPPCAMDFDHVRGTKISNISTMCAGGTQQALIVEIAKCDLICSNCHRIRTCQRGGHSRQCR